MDEASQHSAPKDTAAEVQLSPPDAMTPEWPLAAPRELRIVLSGAMLTMILAALDMNIVNTALPRMASELSGLEHVAWIVAAYMLTSTITVPLYGKLSDMYGRRRLMVVSIGLFLSASMLCGLAGSMTQLILFRALQGLGAGGLMTLSQAVIADVVPPQERGRYQGMFAGAFAISNVAGPVIGGALTSYLSWRWVFYVNLPIGAVAVVLLLAGLRRTPPRSDHRIDYAGALLLTGGSTAVLLLLTGGGSAFTWNSGTALTLALAAATFITLFLLQERRAAEPVLDLNLFRLPAFAIGVTVTGIMILGMSCSIIFLPLYFQLVLGLAPATTGLVLLPQVLALTAGSVAGGRLSSRLGHTKPFILAGLGIAALALSSLALLASLDASVAWFLIVLALLGLGMGVAMPVVMVVIQNAVDRESIGVATATMSFMRSLGGSLGVALSGGVMTERLFAALNGLDPSIDPKALIARAIASLAALPAPLHSAVVVAYRNAISASFLLSGVAMAAACALSLFLPSPPSPERGQERLAESEL
ncbi:MFS transporter [Mesorhizobium sp. B2-1-8]|uniref:MDR family MFS transporter n=1 Tax=Mesorhizobium sp. B2-1-8 TaxID=2589967 RepID=UPI001AED5A32|nr:MDR family MFS transporter [Mesorhizobium sp. B2-1-8]UCI19941.1 MFS transporter [Mesorhizobium sp. B2-1-8]